MPTGALPLETHIATVLKDSEISDPDGAANWITIVQRVEHKRRLTLPYEHRCARDRRKRRGDYFCCACWPA